MEHQATIEDIWLDHHMVDLKIDYDLHGDYEITVICLGHLVKMPIRREWIEQLKTIAEYHITDHERSEAEYWEDLKDDI